MVVVITAAFPWKSAMTGRFSTRSRCPWAARTRSPIWPMSTNIANLFSWNAARKRDEMLELYEGKPSRTVLRRESGSNPTDLAGTIFGGFAPNSQTAEVLSKALGNQTVQGGYISKAKDGVNQSLQMVSRPLMSPDELKAIPKGSFIVMKTGTNPMRTRLRLFLDWGITFGEAYQIPDRGQRKVYYANRRELENAIRKKYPPYETDTHQPPAQQSGTPADWKQGSPKGSKTSSSLRE